jgi:hypothetical protein
MRRVRVGENSPLMNCLIEAGIPHEKDLFSANTTVFSFLIDHGNLRACEDVSPWEQFSLLELMQRCWADNCVSSTIYFDKEKDASDVEKMLAMYIPVLKSVSMLPHSGHGYAQAPYEPISEETYKQLMLGTYNKKVDYSMIQKNIPEGSKFCTSDKCEI